MGQEGFKMAPRGLKMAPDGPKRAPMGDLGPSWGALKVCVCVCFLRFLLLSLCWAILGDLGAILGDLGAMGDLGPSWGGLRFLGWSFVRSWVAFGGSKPLASSEHMYTQWSLAGGQKRTRINE